MNIKPLINSFLLVAINIHPFVSSTPTISGDNAFYSKLYPGASMTFKSPQLCDETVQQYSGYVNKSENDSFFFWFFESRQQPDKDPLTVWINGGPGSSSQLGLWSEMGPCQTNANGTEVFYNQFGSWNQVSNLLFFDQPSNTGFSFSTSNIDTTEKATPLVYIFFQIFLEAFSKYQMNDFHFFGESYSGHFVPAIADYILQQNQLLDGTDHIHINLKSIGLGATVTDPYVQNEFFEKMACDSSYGSILPSSACDVMKENTPICTKLTKKCYETNDQHDCITASFYCAFNLENIISLSGRYPFDIRLTNLQFPYVNYLNQSSILEVIGAKKPYIDFNTQVRDSFLLSGDRIKSRAPHVANLLNNGVRVLVFSGDADYACNWYGNHAWTNRLSFKNDHLYREDTLKPWIVDDKEVGQIQQGGGMTFIKVDNSGHLVPFYHPKLALKMFVDHINCSSQQKTD